MSDRLLRPTSLLFTQRLQDLIPDDGDEESERMLDVARVVVNSAEVRFISPDPAPALISTDLPVTPVPLVVFNPGHHI